MSSKRTPSVNKSMTASTDGKAAISKDEGFRKHPYNDPAGYCTVGTGLLLHKTKCTPEESATTYNKEDLDKNFSTKVQEAQKYVINKVRKTQLTQEQFDALTSFVYNVGIGNATGVLSLADGGEMAKVAEEMSKFVNVKTKDKDGKIKINKLNGLVTRRERESAPFRPAEAH